MTAKSLSDSSKNLSKLIVFIIPFNTADALFTVFALGGGAIEMNPIVGLVLNMGLPWFLFYKLVIVNLLVVFVALQRKYSLSGMGLKLVAWAYFLITLWHVTNLQAAWMTDSEF